MLSLIVLLASVGVSFLVGIFILARNPKNIQNRLYATLTLGFILLSITNYYSLQNGPMQLIFMRLVMAIVTCLATVYYLLIRFFDPSVDKSRITKLDWGMLVVTPLICALDLSPWFFSGITTGANSIPVPKFGVVFFIAHVTVAVFLSVKKLVHGSNEKTSNLYHQYRLLLLGTLPVIIWIFTGFVMPMIFKQSGFVILSPVYTLIFVCMVGYAIIKHKMYDIRFFVIRIIAYTISTVLLALLYVAPLIFILQYLNHIALTTMQYFGLLAGLIVMAINYNRLKIWFDKFTNKIFFSDIYDTAELLRQLNSTLATTSEIKSILLQSAKILQRNLKTYYCAFVIKTSDDSNIRTIGVDYKNIDENQVVQLLDRIFIEHRHTSIIITDELLTKSVDDKRELMNYGIGFALKIQTNGRQMKANKNDIYLVLGYKRSGRSYNQNDVNTMDSIENVLSIAVQNALHYEEIQQFNATLQQKVEEATRKLRVTNEKLKRMDETKDEFISMASHQLRTPLTSVKGYVSMVLDGDVGQITASQRELLQQSFVSSQRMANLISDMLNLSRINTGKFILEPTKVYLPTVIEAELSQLRETALNKNIELKLDIPLKFPTLMLDEGKMHQVIMNLVDNALYYTPDGGSVTVELKETPRTVEFRVVDTGIGVPREAQKHLFTKMYRAENARLARPDGTGLGLFLVKKVILAQGGSIIFETEENKGSTFGFRFNKSTHPVVDGLSVVKNDA